MMMTRKTGEPDLAAAEMLRKMADFVERGEAYTVDFARVVPTWMATGEPVEVEYTVRIKVVEAARRQEWKA